MAYKHAPRQLCGFHGRLLQRVVQGCKKVDIGTGAGHRPYVGQGPALVLRRSAVVTSTTIPSLRRTQLQTSGSEPRAGSQCTSTSRQNCTTPPSPCPSPRVGSGTPLVSPGAGWTTQGHFVSLGCLQPGRGLVASILSQLTFPLAWH